MSEAPVVMKVRCLFHKLVAIEDLKPHPKNRNQHPPEQVEQLASIMRYQGVRKPITVSKRSGFITKGDGRRLAAIENEWDEFPVEYQDYDSEEQEYADVQADNAIALQADLDLAGINTDIGDLGPDFDIDMLGIKDFEIDPKFAPGTEDDQGKLDTKADEKTVMTCPHCGGQFTR